MTSELERPPLQADERTALIGWLDLQRQILRWKCEGLSDEDAHRSVIPTSPAMTMAGLISHMRWTEHTWLEVVFLGGDKKQNPAFDESSEDADWHTDGRPLTELLAEYEAQCARRLKRGSFRRSERNRRSEVLRGALCAVAAAG
ncbi:DUF664 domain-containing protein [Streptomyces sp. NPDC056165]|uniref:mycothiol transferase n=1 Tax=Streptomyces sp. NPDC056165 TaxID=3345733 RepID=UPI0035E26A77